MDQRLSRDILGAFEDKGWYLYGETKFRQDPVQIIAEGPAKSIELFDPNYTKYVFFPKTDAPTNSIDVIAAYQNLQKEHLTPYLNGHKFTPCVAGIVFYEDEAVFISDNPENSRVSGFAHEFLIDHINCCFQPDLNQHPIISQFLQLGSIYIDSNGP